MPKLQNNRINATKIASWDLPIRWRTPNHQHHIQLMFCASLRKALPAKIKGLKRRIIWQGKNLTERKKKDDEKKDRMSKLHSSFLNMLLNASSTDRDRAAKDITAACRSFFNQETAGLDDQQLSVLFRELGFLDVGFAYGVVQTFLSKHFLYHEPGCPNNSSMFCF